MLMHVIAIRSAMFDVTLRHFYFLDFRHHRRRFLFCLIQLCRKFHWKSDRSQRRTRENGRIPVKTSRKCQSALKYLFHVEPFVAHFQLCLDDSNRMLHFAQIDKIPDLLANEPKSQPTNERPKPFENETKSI